MSHEVVIQISEEQHQVLLEILEAAKKDGRTPQSWTERDLIDFTISTVCAGWERPGSWEGSFLTSMLGI